MGNIQAQMPPVHLPLHIALPPPGDAQLTLGSSCAYRRGSMDSGRASSTCMRADPRATGWCCSSSVSAGTSAAAAYCRAASSSSTSLNEAKAEASNTLRGPCRQRPRSENRAAKKVCIMR